jgi:hypothetical protein
MSILEGQIELLAHQVTALPTMEKESSTEIAAAVAIAIGLFEAVRGMETRSPPSVNTDALRALYSRWLEGATTILSRLRSQKSFVTVEDRERFMRAYLRSKWIANPAAPGAGRVRAVPLDEVERELLNRD